VRTGHEFTVVLVALVVVDAESGKDVEQGDGNGAKLGQAGVEHAEMQRRLTDRSSPVKAPTSHVLVILGVSSDSYLGDGISSSSSSV